MRPTDVLDKSDKGQEEIRTRKHKLTGKARMLLLLIDGRHPAFVVREQGAKMGLPDDTLDLLFNQGYLEVLRSAGGAAATTSTTTRELRPASDAAAEDRFAHYTAARRLMTESVFSTLGLKGFMFTLKIEKTGNLDDLRALIPDYQRLMAKSLGDEGAALFVGRLDDLMSGTS
jgi:hypothetical protein